ncbi:hypothetical protein PR048_021171 [Dryococelus australis]|uniref:Uncharacterized protein n=1 Tax=Dryococelus australis TaxID=614101 RepID=A0ABQ9GXG6_9NEOP|nr:hypothetical protein PR048_021171 [Dryococelus australis]
MKHRWNERAGNTGDPQEYSPTNGIVRHDSHLRASEKLEVTANVIAGLATRAGRAEIMIVESLRRMWLHRRQIVVAVVPERAASRHSQHSRHEGRYRPDIIGGSQSINLLLRRVSDTRLSYYRVTDTRPLLEKLANRRRTLGSSGIPASGAERNKVVYFGAGAENSCDDPCLYPASRAPLGNMQGARPPRRQKAFALRPTPSGVLRRQLSRRRGVELEVLMLRHDSNPESPHLQTGGAPTDWALGSLLLIAVIFICLAHKDDQTMRRADHIAVNSLYGNGESALKLYRGVVRSGFPALGNTHAREDVEMGGKQDANASIYIDPRFLEFREGGIPSGGHSKPRGRPPYSQQKGL